MKYIINSLILIAVLSYLCGTLCCCDSYHPVPIEQNIPYGYGVDENGELYMYIPKANEVVEICA